MIWGEDFRRHRGLGGKSRWCLHVSCRQTLLRGAETNEKTIILTAVEDGCDRLDETIEKLAERADARRAPVELSAPDLCIDVEVRLRC